MNAIDPNGCDTFNIQPDYNIRRISDQGDDVVRFVDANGNVKKDDGTSIEKCFGKKGTIDLIDSKETKDEQKGYAIFTADGDKVGTELFEFLAGSGAGYE